MRALLVVTTLVLAAPPTARAGPRDRELARLYFAQGKRHFRAKRYAEAIRAFEQAHRHRPHRVLRFNVALSYARLGRRVAAATHLRRYLKQARPTDPPLPAELRAVMRRVGVVRIKVPNPRAQIFIDGQFVGVGSVEVVLKPGRSAVMVRLGTRVLARRTLRIEPGREQLWELPDADTGPVTTARADPPTATTPSAPRRTGPSLGRRRLGRAWFVAAAALTAAALVAAAATSARTRALHEQFLAAPTDASLRERGIRHQDAAKALWGVTAVTAIGATVIALFTRWSGPERARRVSATPTFGPGSAGVRVTLRY